MPDKPDKAQLVASLLAGAVREPPLPARQLFLQRVVVFLVKSKVWMTAGEFLLHDSDGAFKHLRCFLVFFLLVTQVVTYKF